MERPGSSSTRDHHNLSHSNKKISSANAKNAQNSNARSSSLSHNISKDSGKHSNSKANTLDRYKTSIRSYIRIVQIISFKKRLNLVNRKEQQAHRQGWPGSFRAHAHPAIETHDERPGPPHERHRKRKYRCQCNCDGLEDSQRGLPFRARSPHRAPPKRCPVNVPIQPQK